MRKKKRKVAFPKEVKITRDGDFAHVDFINPNYASVRTQFKPGELTSMTDKDILKEHNEIVFSQERLIRNSRPKEMADGCSQIKYDAKYKQWVPRSDVLRCELTSGERFDELIVCIDDEELSWEDFGRMLKMFMGWGMRLMFLPQGQLFDPPSVEIQKKSK
jgi:hypothetical protein